MPANFLRSAAITVGLACHALPSMCLAADGSSLPSLTRAGPYGDPMLLVPNGVSGPALPLLRLKQGPSGRLPGARSVATISMGSRNGTTATSRDLDDDDDDEEDAPTRPGKLPTSFPKLPDHTPFAKRRSIGPHLSPDLSYEATDRASWGFIGNSARLDGRTTPSVTLPTSATRLGASTIGAKAVAAPTSSVKSRDVGIGLSFQYRFGQ